MLDPARLALLEALASPDSAAGLARRMGLPRQRINYHLRELEEAGLVEFVEERRKGNCTERIVRATARSYLIDPAVLGPLGAEPSKEEDRFNSAQLASIAARTIREVAALRSRSGDRSATLAVEASVRLAPGADRAAFAEDLAGAVAQVVREYHDERAVGGREYQIVVGAYPSSPPDKAPLDQSRIG